MFRQESTPFSLKKMFCIFEPEVLKIEKSNSNQYFELEIVELEQTLLDFSFLSIVNPDSKTERKQSWLKMTFQIFLNTISI